MQISDAIFYLILAYPDKYLKEYISSFSEMKKNLKLINKLKETDYSVNYLVDIIYKYMNSNGRKSFVIVTKLLYRILRNYNGSISFELKNKLFDLFLQLLKKEYSNQWQIHILIRNQELTSEQIDKLLENKNNTFALNRILRYPKFNQIIYEWCKSELKNNKVIDNRFSEYISQTLTSLEDVEDYYKNKNFQIDTLAYAIKYSYQDNEFKTTALEMLLEEDKHNITVIKVAYELELYSIIEKYSNNIKD